jgi:ATP-dependent protease ClpP protease subunit
MTNSPAPAAANDAPDRGSNAVNYPALAVPQVQLAGTVDYDMYNAFKGQVIGAAGGDGPLVFSITTLGGDPEVARAMGDDVRLIREYTGRETLFLGKVAVYSAGATFMSAFPTDKRFLTRDTRLMLHERLMNATVNLSGPLSTLPATLQAKLAEIEHSIKIQDEGFRDIVAGSKVTLDELKERAPSNWYIDAEEARDLGLVLDVI